MAVITPSALISEIRGSVGLQTFSKNRYGAYVKAKLVQTNPNTLPQQDVRNSLAAAIAAWQALSQVNQDKWINFADTNIVGKNISRKIKRAGYNEFVSRWQNRIAISGAGTGYDPLPKVRLYPKLTAITQAAANLSITFDTLTAIGNCDIAIYATPPISPGINNINPNFFRIIGSHTPGAQIETLNIYAMYTALFPLAAPDIGQKIGIAIRAINTDNYAGGGFFFTQTIIGASLIPSSTPAFVQDDFHAVASNGTLIISLPVIPTANNILIAAFRKNNPNTLTPPAGWILIDRQATPNNSIDAYYKICTALESNSYTFTTSGNPTWACSITELTNADIVTPISFNEKNNSGGIGVTNIDCSSVNVNISAGTFVFACVRRAGAANPYIFTNSFANPNPITDDVITTWREYPTAAIGQNTNISQATLKIFNTLFFGIKGA